MSDKELDKIFRSKLYQREYEFNPGNWKKMEALLDQKKRKRIPFYWWTIAGVLLLGAFITGALYVYRTAEPVPAGEQNITGKPLHPGLSDAEWEELLEMINNSENDKKGNSGTRKENENITAASPHSTPPHRQEAPAYSTPSEGIVASPAAETPLLTPEQPLLILTSKGIPEIKPVAVVHEPKETGRIDPEALLKFRKQHELWVQAGPDLSPAYSGKGISAGWLAGVNYRYRFSEKWHLDAALNYAAKTSPGITLSSDSVFYNFGQEVIRTEIETRRMDLVEVPVSIVYGISPRHQIGMGLYTSALFNVKRSVTRTHHRFKQDVEVTETTENGLTESFRIPDYGLTGTYTFQYDPQIEIGVQLKIGLTDVSHDRAPELNPYHRNINTRILFKYKL